MDSEMGSLSERFELGQVSPDRVHHLFDRVSRLEAQREGDLARVVAFESYVRNELSGINTKLDSLIDVSRQRKGVDKVTNGIWDLLKLVGAAVAGSQFANFKWH